MVSFEEARTLVGNKPRIDDREDLIFQKGQVMERWQWSHNIGMGLSEAIGIHRRENETIMIVADKFDVDPGWKKKMGEQAKPAPKTRKPAMKQRQPVQAADESNMQAYLNRVPEVTQEPNLEPGTSEAAADSKWQSKDETAPAPSESIELENGQTIPVVSPGNSTTELAVRVAEDSKPAGWLDDATTASFSAAALLMFGPEIASVIVAADTILPTLFLATQFGFAIAAFVAYRTRGYRERLSRKPAD
jgi:hypothetical protein